FTFYIFKAFTILGNFSTYFLIFAIGLYYSKRIGKNSFFSITLMSCLIGLLVMNVYKYSFVRVRPLDFFKIEQGGYSYVSGHSLVSTSFYFTLSYLLCSLKNYKFIYLRIIPFVIAFSRLVVGVHWPTDVLFGMLVGYVCYLATIFVAEKYIIKSNKNLDEL
ncbi:MAG: phosphatase PAP2 family protein, partial [Finegoldia magna]|nr:phosphatase PAP2 family protein [Finegoldia magna]